MANYPYYSEPIHDTGTVAAKSRGTDTSSAESRLIVDVVDKIFLLSPNNHPLVTFLTNIGRSWDGTGYKGSGLLKAAAGNPE